MTTRDRDAVSPLPLRRVQPESKGKMAAGHPLGIGMGTGVPAPTSIFPLFHPNGFALAGKYSHGSNFSVMKQQFVAFVSRPPWKENITHHLS